MFNRDLAGTRFSPPTQINRTNVAGLSFVIGARRYRIGSMVEITALRPRRAEVIPIDSRRTRRNTDQNENA